MTIAHPMRQKIVMSVLLLSLAGCGRTPREKLYTETAVLCGTFAEIKSPRKEALGIAFEEMRRLCAVFNFYDAQSELSKINDSYNEEVSVSPEMIEVLRLAKEVYLMTGGAFDVSCGALFGYWKNIIRSPETTREFPDPETIKRLREQSGMDFIEINRQRNTVKLHKKGITIDLSGIAKGYIVDKAIEKVKKKGISSCIINCGGDLYCLGTFQGKPWEVGIRDPRNPRQYFTIVPAVDAAIATSGNYEQFFTRQGKKYSHLIDPKTGYPVAGATASSTVIAPTLALADGLATGFFVMGPDKVRAFINAHQGWVRAILVEEDHDGRKRHYFR